MAAVAGRLPGDPSSGDVSMRGLALCVVVDHQSNRGEKTSAEEHVSYISSCRHWMSRLPRGTSVAGQHTAKIMRNSKASLQITPQRPAKAGCVAIEAQRGPQGPVSFPHHGMINMSLRCKKRPTFQHFRATNDRPILWIDFHATPVCPTKAARSKRRTCNWDTQGQTQVRLGSFGLLLPRSRDSKLMARANTGVPSEEALFWRAARRWGGLRKKQVGLVATVDRDVRGERFKLDESSCVQPATWRQAFNWKQDEACVFRAWGQQEPEVKGLKCGGPSCLAWDDLPWLLWLIS